MVLLVAPSRRALPAITIPGHYRRLILSRQHQTAEAQVARALASGDIDLVLSMGFAASVDQRLAKGDLLVATRVFGAADVYLDLPPFQAPGAVRGSLGTMFDDVGWRSRRRLPPVYALDLHGFWLAHVSQAAGVPCLLLRSILLEVTAEPKAPDPLVPELLAGRLGCAALRRPERWRELSEVHKQVLDCRSHLASALAIFLVLYGHA
jgi:hypothetical protein